MKYVTCINNLKLIFKIAQRIASYYHGLRLDYTMGKTSMLPIKYIIHIYKHSVKINGHSLQYRTYFLFHVNYKIYLCVIISLLFLTLTAQHLILYRGFYLVIQARLDWLSWGGTHIGHRVRCGTEKELVLSRSTLHNKFSDV